jgi:hypothetical protein
MTQTPTTPTTFTASGAPTTLAIPSGVSGSFVTLPLPIVDTGNTALTVTNGCGDVVFLNFGTAPSIPTSQAGLRVNAGQTLLVPVIAGAATMIGIAPVSSVGGSIVVSRGSVTTATVFK